MYTASHTENFKRFRNYTSTFGGRQRSTKSIKLMISCTSYVKFMENRNNILLVDNYHIHNHPINEFFTKTYRTCLSSEMKEKINSLQEMEIDAEQIRMITNVNIPPQQFYNIRRQTVKEMRQNQIVELKKELNTWVDWKIINEYEYIENKKKISNVTAINNNIATSNYGFDIQILDDTECTNSLKMDLECIICMDENGNSQLFGFSSNKTTSGFQQLFSNIKTYFQREVRLVVMDRCVARSMALINVYQLCLYILTNTHYKEF